MKNTIRVARAEQRMTQQELADKVDVSRQTINAIESRSQEDLMRLGGY